MGIIAIMLGRAAAIAWSISAEGAAVPAVGALIPGEETAPGVEDFWVAAGVYVGTVVGATVGIAEGGTVGVACAFVT